MQLSHDHFGGGNALAGVDIGRNPASIVDNRAGSVRIERDSHKVRVPRQGLVDGVVDHLVDHVVQARTVIGIADIHAGPLADGIQPLQNLDGIGAVLGTGSGIVLGLVAHEMLSSDCCGKSAEFLKRIVRYDMHKI